MAVPTALARYLGEPIIAIFVRSLHTLRYLLFPLIKLLNLVDRLVLRTVGNKSEPEPEQIEKDILSVVEDGEKVCRRPIKRYNPDGTTFDKLLLVCERCWEPVPEYVGAPNGFVSPDSARKLYSAPYEGKAAIYAGAKIVCYDCLREDHIEMFGTFAEIPHELKA